MKRFLLLFLPVLALLLPAPSFAQKASELNYVDAQNLMLINQGYDNTELYYSRLPEDLKASTRKGVWDLGLNSAGLAIRFSTDSRTIGFRWTLLNNFRMTTGSSSARASPTGKTRPKPRSSSAAWKARTTSIWPICRSTTA